MKKLWLVRSFFAAALLVFFSTNAQGQWGGATVISNTAGGAIVPQIAMDAGGNAVAAWPQYNGVGYDYWTNRYTSGVGWGTAVLIETDASGTIAVDSNGNAIAVYGKNDGTRNNVWAKRYVAGSGWGTPTLIENYDAGNTVASQIAMDPSGNAIVVGRQFDGVRWNAWANRYNAVNGSWGTATLIETNDGNIDTGALVVTMGHGGDAIAAWSQYDGTHYNIWTNRYSLGSGWGARTWRYRTRPYLG